MKDTVKSVASFVLVNALAGVVQVVASTLTQDCLDKRRKKETPSPPG